MSPVVFHGYVLISKLTRESDSFVLSAIMTLGVLIIWAVAVSGKKFRA